jgi:uncharacterized protein YjdB
MCTRCGERCKRCSPATLKVSETAATLTSIALTPALPSIAKGTMLELAATGTYSDGTMKNVTAEATWTSSDVTVATVAKGLVSGLIKGVSTITATVGTVKGTVSFTVTDATLAVIQVTSADGMVAKGIQEKFTATGVFSDDTKQDLTKLAQWASSDPAVTISNVTGSQGLGTAATEGVATISATFMSVTGSMTFQVTSATLDTISVTPFDPTIAKGTVIAFNATGLLTDHTVVNLTPFVKWDSSDVKIVKFGGGMFAAGVATALDVGKVTISASYKALAGTTTLTVSGATLSKVDLVPLNPAIAKGTSLWMAATGIYSDKTTQDLTHWVVWTSSDASVAVSNAFDTHGLALGQVEGDATLTATFMGGVAGTTQVHVTAATLVSLAVTPQAPAIAKGTTVQLSVVGTYTDNAKQDLSLFANWQSSDPSVAVGNGLSSPGLATGVTQGTATVTAYVGGKSATTQVTVTAATLVSLALAPVNPTLAKGTAIWLTVTGTYTDSTTQDVSSLATWSSSDESRAVVSNVPGARGLVTGIGPGAATISADFGGKTAATSVTVTVATLSLITVTPASPTVVKNGTRQLTALGMFTDNTVQNITNLVIWSSSDPAKAIVSNAIGSKGLVTGVAEGPATISAGLAGKGGSVVITVTP